MNNKEIASCQLGGKALILAGILFALNFLCLSLIPPLPDNSIDIARWLVEAKTLTAVSNEITFFGTLCLIPGIYALFIFLYNEQPVKAFLGSALLSILVILFIILVIVQGRLCYPVISLSSTSQLTLLILSLFWGCLHLIFLIASIINLIYGFAFYKSGKHIYLSLSIILFLTNIIGSFPWEIGPELALVAQFGFCFWFILTGFKLLHSNTLNAIPPV